MRASRLEQLAFGSVVWLFGCQPSAASPPEQTAPDASIVERCLAQTHPIVVNEIELPLAWLVLTTIDGNDSLPLAGGSHVYGAVWSHDGRTMAFRRHGERSEDGTTPAELGLLTVDGANEVTLFEDWVPYADNLTVRLSDGPSWSPDGRALAFSSRHEADHARIWSISRSGGQLRLLLPELDAPHFYPRWSVGAPERLAFIAEVDGRQDLFVTAPLAGIEPENLTRGRLARPESPSWSPDDRFIAFSAEAPAPDDPALSNRDIYVLDVDTHELQRMTVDPHVDTQPAWAPDGARILFSSNRSRATQPDPISRQWFELWMLTLVPSLEPETQLNRPTSRSRNDAEWFGNGVCGLERGPK